MKNIFITILRLNFAIAVLSIFSLEAMAQAPVADFTSDITIGCLPQTIQFTDKSTGSPNSWKWDFGNGNTSTLQNPSVTYVNQGTFTVTLVATNASGSSTKVINDAITINKPPVAKFTVDDSLGCRPFLVNFTDLSIQGTGLISSWTWDFGDGGTSSEQNPQYTYTTPGKYKITLKVFDEKGCPHSIIKSDRIEVTSPPSVTFSATPRVGCNIPMDVSFTDLTVSSGSSIVSWDWYFGDSTNQVITQNPTHTYTQFGKFDVTLNVEDSAGCLATITSQQHISIIDFNTDFILDSVNQCGQLQISLKDTSTPDPNAWIWKIDTITTLNGQNNSYIFNESGTYDITLISSNSANCKDTMTKTFSYQKIKVDFEIDTAYACSVPFDVQFTNNSTGAGPVQYLWYFGYNEIDSISDPMHTFGKTDVDTIKLFVTDGLGCVDSLVFPDTIEVNLPVASFAPLPAKGCVPINSIFTNSSTSKEKIISWSWDFGDPASGILNTDTSKNTSHLFNNIGAYDVVLTLENELGCTAGQKVTVGIGQKPDTVNFHILDPVTMLPITKVCYKDSVFIVDSSGYFGNPPPPGLVINEWHWNLYYNDTIGVAYNAEPPKGTVDGVASFTYVFDDGIAAIDTIFLTVGMYGCLDTVTKIIEIEQPVAIPAYSDLGVCNFPYTLQVSDSLSYGGEAFSGWTVTEITTGNIVTDPNNNATFDLIRPGKYAIEMGYDNASNGCKNTQLDTLRIDSASIGFIVDTSYTCLKNNKTTFKDTSFTRFGNISNWRWEFGNGVELESGTNPGTLQIKLEDSHNDSITGTYSNPSYVYKDTGNYVVRLTLTSSFNRSPFSPNIKTCFYTMEHNVEVHDVFPMFTVQNDLGVYDTSACSPYGANLLDTSIVTSQFESRVWTFGDGTINDSLLQNPAHTYVNNGFYTVSLTITDTIGCSRKITKQNYIEVTFPHPKFTAKKYECVDVPVVFTNTSIPDSLTYFWNFSNGDTSTSKSFTNTFLKQDSVFVTLQTIDKNGCDSTTTPFLIITADKPKINFGVDNIVADCPPLDAKFWDSTYTYFAQVNGGYPHKYLWSFGDSSVSTLKDPSHSYTYPGYYDVSLIVEDSIIGCKDTLIKEKFIYVSGPYAVFDYGPKKGCAPLEVTYIASNLKSVDKMTWDFGDGTVLPNAPLEITHTYTSNGKIFPNLTIFDSLGCKVPVLKDSMILIKPLAAFTIDSAIYGFENPDVHFINQSQRADLYFWEFGDSLYPGGNTSNATNPNHIYEESGKYKVTLISMDSLGCTDTTYQFIDAYPQITTGNVFTPNGDGVNDQFYFRGLKPGSRFMVFNRWGRIVYENGNYANDWDGRDSFGNPLKSAVYYYVLQEPNTNEFKNGWLVLVR